MRPVDERRRVVSVRGLSRITRESAGHRIEARGARAIRALRPRRRADRGQGLGHAMVQELLADGLHAVTRYRPQSDKVMRMHAQTAMIENGSVRLPDQAPWLAPYLAELTAFPNAKHDDEVELDRPDARLVQRRRPRAGRLLWLLQNARQRASRSADGQARAVTGWWLPAVVICGADAWVPWRRTRAGTVPRSRCFSAKAAAPFDRRQRRLMPLDRDRGAPRDATPPPPPGIRVRTTAVRLG